MRRVRLALFFILILSILSTVAVFSTGLCADFPLPPKLYIPHPPVMAPLPGTNVYAIWDIDVDVAFYQGWWWRRDDGRWFRARDYNGPWGIIIARRVPRILQKLPPNFRKHGAEERIPDTEVKKNWKQWEKERRWEDKSQRKMERKEERHIAKEERKKGGRDERGASDSGRHGKGNR